MGKPLEVFRASRIAEIEESIAFFSNRSKRERELWVAKQFLSGYLPFETLERATIPLSDPPDVVFDDISFEVKEILDGDRRRHLELQAQLERAKLARKYSDFLEAGKSLRRVTSIEVIDEIVSRAERLSKRYSREFCSSVDLLFYVNYRAARYEHSHEELHGATRLQRFGFRSISFVFHRESVVLLAADHAPQLFRQHRSKRVVRDSYF